VIPSRLFKDRPRLQISSGTLLSGVNPVLLFIRPIRVQRNCCETGCHSEGIKLQAQQSKRVEETFQQSGPDDLCAEI